MLVLILLYVSSYYCILVPLKVVWIEPIVYHVHMTLYTVPIICNNHVFQSYSVPILRPDTGFCGTDHFPLSVGKVVFSITQEKKKKGNLRVSHEESKVFSSTIAKKFCPMKRIGRYLG